jgi:uncharacterized protein YjbI with pentapeptide repeats
MANLQHVEWLKEGVEAWNSIRKKVHFSPDLSGARLNNLNLSEYNLENSNLSFCDLTGSLLSGANLSGSNLISSILRDCDLTATKLESCNFQKSVLSNSSLVTANLEDCNFSLATLYAVNFKQANLSGANFESADLQWACLDGAELKHADFERSDLRGASIKTLLFEIAPDRYQTLETDISNSLNLTKSKLSTMAGDSFTIIPMNLSRPTHWPIFAPENAGYAEKTTTLVPTTEEPDNADERVRPWYPAAQQTLAPITPIADVAWTPTGELDVQNLTPITPTPRKAVPIPSPEALVEIKRGLHGLCQQLRTQLASSFSPNAAAFIGDADHLFGAIEAQLERPDTEIIPLLVQVNFTALERLSPSAEALADTEEVIFNAFIEQGHKYLKMLPVLRLINDPYNEDMIPDDKVDDALDGLAKIDTLLDQPDIVAQIGPKLGGVTRESDGFPWESDKQKIANKTAMWMQVLDKLENPPKAIKGTGTYMAVVAPLIASIVWVLMLLFG